MPTWIALIDPISRLLDNLIPDPAARERAKAELRTAEMSAEMEALKLALGADQAQTAINAKEAENPEIFVSGWRPFIGWVCGAAFAYHFVLQPFLAFAIANAGGEARLPAFDMETLSTVLMGLLGLGSLRTMEKLRGAAR